MSPTATEMQLSHRMGGIGVARDLRARVCNGPVLGEAGLPAFAELRRGKPALPLLMNNTEQST
jgi:hypothetical protein